jgi:predicted  nucleic acid-binding Zn-ribbon protein
MKKTIYKIIGIIVAFAGLIALVFKSSNKTAKVDKEIKDTAKKIVTIQTKVVKVEQDKIDTKQKIATSKEKIATIEKNKKSTTKAKAIAQKFKNKYKSKK